VSTTGRTILRELSIFALFVALAVAMTWPLAIHLDRAVTDPSDPLLTTSILEWDYYATFHGIWPFNANFFAPTRNTLALTEHTYGIAMLLFPLFALGIAPLTIHNIAMILGFAGCGYAMFLLCRFVTRSAAAGIVGGIAYAFVGTRFHHLTHVQYVWSMWLPLLLLCALRFVRRPNARNAAWLGVAIVMNGLTTMHWLMFGTFTVTLTLLALGIAMKRNRRFWLLLFATYAIAFVTLLPFVLPYHQWQKKYGERWHYADVVAGSAAWSDWFRVDVYNKLYAPFYEPNGERTLFPGFIVLVLAAFAVAVRVRKRIHLPLVVWTAILWLVIGAWGARGVLGAFHSALFLCFAAFRGIRMPVRWVMIAYVGLSLLASIGFARLIRNRRAFGAIVVGAAMLFELHAAPIRWYMMPLERRDLYPWLAKTPISGSILELPMTQTAAYEYLWRSTAHHKPLINGVASASTSGYVELNRLYESRPISPDLLTRLEQSGCSLIVVHAGWLRERREDVREWLRDGVASGRLIFVQRFDAGLLPDYVFALTRVEPQMHASREADNYIDTKGWTQNHSTFGNVDVWPDGVIRGPLVISGWALSPWDVREVNLLFDNGRVVIPADRFENPGLSAAMPWYPKTTKPGFAKRIEEPPDGIDGDTNFQVEIIDGRGESRRLPPAFFTWHERDLHQ